MRLTEKDNILLEHIYHEYDILWNYFIKTHEERNNLYNMYFLIIGVPITAIGVLIGINSSLENFYQFKYIISFILLAIFLIGVSLYIAYCITSINTSKYLKQINNIRRFIIDKYDNKTNDTFTALFKEWVFIYDNKNRYRSFSLLKLLKSLPLPIINSLIFIGVLYFMMYKNLYYNIYFYYAFFFILILMHILIFIIMSSFSKVYSSE